MIDDGGESQLGEDNGDKESYNINKENRFFTNSSIRVKNKGDKEDKNKEAGEFSGKIIGIYTIDEAVYEAPE